MQPSSFRRRLNARYDKQMFDGLVDELSGYSGFHNLGLWEADVHTLAVASERLMRRLLDYLPEKIGRVLDVACGLGSTTRYLASHYPSAAVAAINISEAQIAHARRAADGCAFAVMDAAALGFSTDSFDAVVCVEAAFHFRTRERFLAEAWRVLRPGGHLVLSDLLMSREMEGRLEFRHVENYLVGPEEYARLLAEMGYVETQMDDVTRLCIDPYYRNVLRFLHDKMRGGTLPGAVYQPMLRFFTAIQRACRYYLLVCTRKPLSATPSPCRIRQLP